MNKFGRRLVFALSSALPLMAFSSARGAAVVPPVTGMKWDGDQWVVDKANTIRHSHELEGRRWPAALPPGPQPVLAELPPGCCPLYSHPRSHVADDPLLSDWRNHLRQWLNIGYESAGQIPDLYRSLWKA